MGQFFSNPHTCCDEPQTMEESDSEITWSSDEKQLLWRLSKLYGIILVCTSSSTDKSILLHNIMYKLINIATSNSNISQIVADNSGSKNGKLNHLNFHYRPNGQQILLTQSLHKEFPSTEPHMPLSHYFRRMNSSNHVTHVIVLDNVDVTLNDLRRKIDGDESNAGHPFIGPKESLRSYLCSLATDSTNSKRYKVVIIVSNSDMAEYIRQCNGYEKVCNL